MRQDIWTESSIAKFMAVCITLIIIVIAIVFGVCWVSKQKADTPIISSEKSTIVEQSINTSAEQEDPYTTTQEVNNSVHIEMNNGTVNINMGR